MPVLLSPQTELLVVKGNVSSLRRTDSAFYLSEWRPSPQFSSRISSEVSSCERPRPS